MRSKVRVRSVCLIAASAIVTAATTRQAVGKPVVVAAGPEALDISAGQVLVQGPWGSGPGEFGKRDEASRPGPMDFVVTDDALYVLDPVNARVQVFGLDGGFRSAIPIGTKTADFLCVQDGGQVIVLDAFVRREVKAFTPVGDLIVRADLPESIGLPSGLFAWRGHVWVEERHNRIFEIMMDGGGCERRTAGVGSAMAGRPLRGQCGSAQACRDGTHRVLLRFDDGAAAEPVTLEFPRPVASIAALESDGQGRLYVAVTCGRDTVGDPWKADIVLASITADGQLVGSVRMPDAYVTDHYRKVGVSASGSIVQMQTTEEEVRFVRWSLATRSNRGETP